MIEQAGTAQTAERPPRVLMVVNVEWFFLSHRLPIALALKRAGCEVTIAAAVERGLDGVITGHGLGFVPLSLDRGSTGVAHNLAYLRQLYRLYRRHRPDVVHHVTVKPMLFGSLAARLAGVPHVINAVPGMGYLFARDGGPRARLAMLALRVSCGSPRARAIFQNSEDRAAFLEAGVTREERTVLIKGSGVNLTVFAPAPEPEGRPVVLMASRLLWDKGVNELVEAARLLKARGSPCRVVIAGAPDQANPGAVPVERLQAWVREGVIEWLGHRSDIPAVLCEAAIVVLPSYYREGVPKSLLEACAAGKPIVTTDQPGCRDAVRHGENGLLVPPRDAHALAAAIEELVEDPGRRARMGAAGRARAEREFSEESVVAATLDVYRALLGPRWPAAPEALRTR